MARMWMVRGEGGSLYEAFREHGIAAIGWQQISAQAKPGIARKQLIALYQSAEPQMKQGSVISGASQVWRFVNEIQDGDWAITYSPANRTYMVGQVNGPSEHHPEWVEQGMPLARKVRWQPQELARDNLSASLRRWAGRAALTAIELVLKQAESLSNAWSK
ncbi:hypothetical protein P3W55_16180 [Pseudomonas citronellolis]|uniref:Restriction endonuclease n=1 Tax=Pseudomonas citronellolis TaxID=53408 RepID=A0AAW6P9P9_9PSED|nr:hypothetical protein [Pseudomonas citronellolis]MDF3843252.1 hypothetical protein [Pseudomonas citronellolis]